MNNIYQKNTISTIYMATNKITKLSYIGFTSCDLLHRINEHKYDSKRSDTYFYRAAKKYGWDSFEWIILYQSWDVEHCHKIMESFFISEYDTYENGYNSTMGGDGVNSKTMLDRWSDSNSPYKKISYIKKQSESIKKLHLDENSVYKSTAYIQKQKKVHIEKYGLKFIAISPDGTIYKQKGLKEFCKVHNLTPQCAGQVLKGHKPSHKGWLFYIDPI